MRHESRSVAPVPTGSLRTLLRSPAWLAPKLPPLAMQLAFDAAYATLVAQLPDSHRPGVDSYVTTWGRVGWWKL